MSSFWSTSLEAVQVGADCSLVPMAIIGRFYCEKAVCSLLDLLLLTAIESSLCQFSSQIEILGWMLLYQWLNKINRFTITYTVVSIDDLLCLSCSFSVFFFVMRVSRFNPMRSSVWDLATMVFYYSQATILRVENICTYFFSKYLPWVLSNMNNWKHKLPPADIPRLNPFWTIISARSSSIVFVTVPMWTPRATTDRSLTSTTKNMDM